jgi:hypothetical protein
MVSVNASILLLTGKPEVIATKKPHMIVLSSLRWPAR